MTCAGIIKKADYLELEPAAWERTIGVNLTGTWLVLQRAARRMVAAGHGGAMVAISSVAGRGPRATAVDYAASKAGVISVVRSSAVALAKHGIRVNAVCPGVVDTAMTDAIHEQTARELGITGRSPWRAWSRASRWVASSRPMRSPPQSSSCFRTAAAYVTGQSLNVCGGLEFD